LDSRGLKSWATASARRHFQFFLLDSVYVYGYTGVGGLEPSFNSSYWIPSTPRAS